MSYDTIYQMKKTITLSQKLVADKPEFADYTGGSPDISQTIALIDSIIDAKMIGEESLKTLNFFRSHLIRQNKALFASMVSELSKLSFYFGLKDDAIDAT